MAETATPHDAVFKTFLSRVETARDFIELHLPPSLTQICKLDTLRLESGSFLEDDLRPYYSDILYSLETTRGAGYVHVLIEHQSAPDKLMAFRLMRYAIAAMQRHLESGHKTLPLVIPILFYQGRRSPYPWSMRWLDNFADPETASQLYSGAFPLVDITVIPDDDIMQHRSMAALTLVQKHIRQRTTNHRIGKLYGSGRGCRRYSDTLVRAGTARAAAWRITDDAGGNMACRRYGERHQGRRTARHKRRETPGSGAGCRSDAQSRY